MTKFDVRPLNALDPSAGAGLTEAVAAIALCVEQSGGRVVAVCIAGRERPWRAVSGGGMHGPGRAVTTPAPADPTLPPTEDRT